MVTGYIRKSVSPHKDKGMRTFIGNGPGSRIKRRTAIRKELLSRLA